MVGPRGAKLDELGIGNGAEAAGLKLVAIRSGLNEVTVVTAQAAFFGDLKQLTPLLICLTTG